MPVHVPTDDGGVADVECHGQGRVHRRGNREQVNERLLQAVQFQVQLEDVHARFSQDSPLTSLRVLSDHLSDRSFVQTTSSRDAPDLILGGRRADVRVQSTAGCRDQIDRDGGSIFRIGCFQCIDPALDGFHQSFIRGSEIRSG